MVRDVGKTFFVVFRKTSDGCPVFTNNFFSFSFFNFYLTFQCLLLIFFSFLYILFNFTFVYFIQSSFLTFCNAFFPIYSSLVSPLWPCFFFFALFIEVFSLSSPFSLHFHFLSFSHIVLSSL